MRLVIQGEPHEIERVARALARIDEIPEGKPEPPRPKPKRRGSHLSVVHDPSQPLPSLTAGGESR